MTFITRLRVLTAVLGLTAVVVAVGTGLFGDVRNGTKPADPKPNIDGMPENLAKTRFSELPTVTYKMHGGSTLFAWQVKPQLDAAPPRPRDVVVLVDTSASQAGLPLRQARQIVQGFADSCSPDDRIHIMVANTPKTTRGLTRELVAPNSEELRNATASLTEIEYGSGAVDLKIAIEKALEALPRNRGRQAVVLLLGDGESAFAPVSEADRVALGNRMDQDDVFFFAVPLGLKVDPANLHGFAAHTGGSVVRLQEDLANPSLRAKFVARLKMALDVPVLKPEKVAFGPEVAEFYPSKIPPLRADRPTLVIGKLAGPAEKLTAKISGRVANRPVERSFTEVLTASRPDHYFLNVMLEQWKSTPHRDAPAMLQADRALALASTQVSLYREEYLTQAVWAIKESKLDVAVQMYESAQRIDPGSLEAATGLKLTESMKAGKVTRADIAQRIAEKAKALKITPDEAAKVVLLQEPVPTPPAPTTAPGAEADLLRQAAANRAVEEGRYRVLVESTIRQARQLLRTNPDAAYQDLKRQLEDVQTYDALGDSVRRQLVADLEAQMRDIATKGAEIKRQAAAEREQIARTRHRLNEFDRQQAFEDQTKARIDAFRQLMHQARFELAYQEAQLMIQERVARGQTVPNQAVASYIIGQQATHLREWFELVRLRDDRFLLTMLQTEKSHIPYPDEPPVHFPPASVWRELTAGRKERYENVALGAEPPASQKILQSKVEGLRVSYEGDINNVSLFDILQTLSRKYDVTFIINEEAFKNDNMEQMIRERKPTLTATRLDGLTLGAFLDLVLGSMNASYLVRPDFIEVTTQIKRLEEKVTRAFPVADLVIPIPNSIALSGLALNLSVQGAFANQIQQANFLGNLGAGLNAGGFGGAGLGGAGGGVGGAGGGAFPNLGQQGVQGNFLGIQGGGGNVGQFGNLGGQFGIQGQTQETELINLIVDVVARGEWKMTQDPNNPNAPMIEELAGLTPKMFNSLGYYGPARALLIRGSSRYHPNSTVQLRAGGGMAQGPGQPNNGALVIGPNTPKPDAVAQAADRPANNPLVANQNLKNMDRTNPKKMWHQVIAATIEDPGVIVAASEFLMEFREPMHAAEVLKANLRKGLATSAWAHDALAVSLQASQANADEIERAASSAIDLDPKDGKAYLRAAKAEADLKNYPQALNFCKRAADLAPDLPGAYANALVYAEKSDGVKTDVVNWAAENLLRRDWPTDGIDYPRETKARLEKIAAKFDQAGRGADAAPIRKVLNEQTERELVVELRWEGMADLDLSLVEPSGAVCNATHKRTTGGGVLKADILEQSESAGLDGSGGRSEIYMAAKAFNGTYKVNVKRVLGRPIDDRAQIVVKRFAGTSKETSEFFPVDVRKSDTIEFTLEGGSRTELAVVPADEDEFRLSTTGAVANKSPSGLSGGGGTAGTALSTPLATNAAPPLPAVNEAQEARLPGAAPSAVDLRAATRVNPDRRTVRVSVNPVFGGASINAIALPRVPLLPGADPR